MYIFGDGFKNGKVFLKILVMIVVEMIKSWSFLMLLLICCDFELIFVFMIFVLCFILIGFEVVRLIEMRSIFFFGLRVMLIRIEFCFKV